MKKIKPDLWKHKAMAFATRAHRHLWGKNNEAPLAFLYRQGLSIAYSRSLYLGWNKFGQSRPLANWGFEGEGTFDMPAGIVFPYIVDKSLLSVFIVSMVRPGEVLRLPGSDPGPVVLGSRGKPLVIHDLLKGLILFQDNPDSTVTIAPE